MNSFRTGLRVRLLGAGVAALCAWAAPAFAQTMFRGDAAHSGRCGEAGPATLKGVKWTFKTGGAVVSSPTLADGSLFIGSDDKALHALDAATGAEKWKFDTEGLVRSTAAVVDGVAYFGSYDGNVYAVGAADGKLRWKFATQGEHKFTAKGLHGMKPRAQVYGDPWDCYLSSPAVAGGIVYVGSGDGHVYALAADSGKLVWQFATGDIVHASPAVSEGTVYVGSWDTFFYALDAATGALKWKFKTGADPENHNQEGIQSSATVVDGVVYFGCRDFHLYALDAKTGAEKWKHKITWINATPTVRDGRVHGSTSIPAMFFALDAKTGEEVWRVDVKVPAFASPTLAGGLAYVGSFSGRLHAIDLEKRAIAWTFETEASKANARHALTPEGGLNYAALFPSDFYENMYTAVGDLFALGAIVSSPVVDNGVLYVGSCDGSVYALE